MTFKKFQKLFATKYPEGRVWMHDEFEHGAQGRRQKVAVEFQPNGKTYMYRGAYEDILCQIGIKVISKERFSELEMRLARLKEWNGTDDFFGGVIDNADAIQKLEEQIDTFKKDWIIA